MENLNEEDMKNIKDLYCEILQTNDLSNVSLEELMAPCKPDTLFERFAARKAN